MRKVTVSRRRSTTDNVRLDGWQDFHGYMVRGLGTPPRAEPRKEVAPPVRTSADIAERFSSRRRRSDNRHTIRFGTLDELKRAVLVFGGGSPLALGRTIGAIGDACGGPAAAFAAVHLGVRGASDLAKSVVADIGDLDRPNGYRGSWDYAPGPFHKASLTATRNPDGTFGLGIYAAYVGNEPERALAKQVGAALGFSSCEVQALWAPRGDGDRFAIPLSDLSAACDAIAPDAWDEDAFLASLTRPRMDPYEPGRVDEHHSPVTLLGTDGIVARVELLSYMNVPRYRRRHAPARDYELRIEHGFLTGPALVCDTFGLPQSAALEFTVAPSGGLSYDAALEARILETCDRLEAALDSAGLPALPIP